MCLQDNNMHNMPSPLRLCDLARELYDFWGSPIIGGQSCALTALCVARDSIARCDKMLRKKAAEHRFA